MRLKYQRIHIGRRTVKTALAVIVSMVIVSFYGATTSKMIFAMLGAMGAMEPSFQKSVEACLTQIVGMTFGVLAGVLLLSLPIHTLICVGIGIIAVITLYNVLQIRFSPVLPCMIIVTLCTTPDIQPFTYAIGRLWDTVIGLGVGMLINVLVLPYDNSLKIHNTIAYLEKEVIIFLEDMFDGDTDYPNTMKMTRTIDDMGCQLGIYSRQWMPFKEKQNHRRLEVFRKCQGKARQLLAQMEVLCRMDAPGRLSEESRKFLKESGAEIKDKRVPEEMTEIDVITNYHVKQILALRKELMETLEEISAQGK
uniref:FUSC family protein n=1 Tax=Agathobacter sp. TaxID=2021311 RepID=UPI0040569B08